MPQTTGFQLTPDDITIITAVYYLRRAQIHHIEALTKRSRRKLSNRLLQLTKNKYLYRRRNSPYEKFTYTINKEAAPILVEQGIAPKETLDIRVRLHELTDLFLKHSLQLADIQSTLRLLSKTTPIKLIDWQEARPLFDSATVYDEHGEEQKLPIRPDAYFTLEDSRRPAGKNQTYFFLEADRSTTTNQRFQKKIQAYHNWQKQGLCEKKFGIRNFRVITTTLSKARAINLAEVSRQALPKLTYGKFYYFTTADNFTLSTPELILDPIFTSARDYDRGETYQLIPPLSENSNRE